MGVCLMALFDTSLPSANAFNTDTDGKCLAAFLPLLDEISAAKVLPPFSRYIVDFDEIDWEETDPSDLPALWFDPVEGLREVSILIDAIRTENEWVGQFSGQAGGVVGSLELLLRDLETASQGGAYFSLSFS